MRRKIVKTCIIGLSMLMCLSASIGFAAYIIASPNDGNVSDVVTNDTKQLHKVVISHNGHNETRYIEAGTSISLDDVPSDKPQNGYYQWKVGNSVVLDRCDSTLQKFIPTGDVTIASSVVTASDSLVSGGNTLNPDVIKPTNGDKGNPNTPKYTVNGNEIKLQEDTAANASHPTNDIEIGGYLNDKKVISSYVGNEGKDVVQNDLSYKKGKPGFVNQANGDETIALEDPACPENPNDPYEKYYRPARQASAGVNHCINRITLKSDLILDNPSNTNNSDTFVLSAMAGFFGNNCGWSQRNMQGFIIGDYSEIDLNGHNLILGNGCRAKMLGSITNSRRDLGGKIIMEPGSSMIATLVVEEHVGEKSLPVQYVAGGDLLMMYKMPYLNCDIEIKSGAKLYGILRLDFGGNKNNFIDEQVGIVGPDASFIIQMNGGRIERNTHYDNNVYTATGDLSFVKNNLMGMMIDYKFYDTSVIINEYHISAKIEGISFTLDLNRNGYTIPPYYQIYLYNTTLKNSFQLTFLPGSYLYVDALSTIIFSAKNVKTADLPETFLLLSSTGLKKALYQNIARLNFAFFKSDFGEAASNGTIKGWIDDVHETQGQGLGGSFSRILLNGGRALRQFNLTRHAKCDLYGKISFENIPGAGRTDDICYELGGNINIYNYADFKNKVNGRNDVKLYSSKAQVTNCMSFDKPIGGGPLGNHGISVSDFYISPLVCVKNGKYNAIMNFEPTASDAGIARSNAMNVMQEYNPYTGITTLANGHKYALIHTDIAGSTYNASSEHVNKCYNGNNDNSFYQTLDSNYVKPFMIADGLGDISKGVISISNLNYTSGQVGIDGNLYIFFRGTFVPATFDAATSTGTIRINKFRGLMSNLGNVGHTRNVRFVASGDSYYTYPTWRLK